MTSGAAADLPVEEVRGFDSRRISETSLKDMSCSVELQSVLFSARIGVRNQGAYEHTFVKDRS